MEKALFDWPILLQSDVKAKYRLISRKVSGMKFFCVRLLFLFCSRGFISRSDENRSNESKKRVKKYRAGSGFGRKNRGIVGLGGKNKREAGIIFENPFVDPPL